MSNTCVTSFITPNSCRMTLPRRMRSTPLDLFPAALLAPVIGRSTLDAGRVVWQAVRSQYIMFCVRLVRTNRLHGSQINILYAEKTLREVSLRDSKVGIQSRCSRVGGDVTVSLRVIWNMLRHGLEWKYRRGTLCVCGM
jgi:hypothetical protein